MIVLDTTGKKLQFSTTSTASTDFVASWADMTTTTFVPGCVDGNVAAIATTDLVLAPAASTQRQVKSIAITNKGTTAQGVTVVYQGGAARTLIGPVSLAGGETLQYEETSGWMVLDVAGRTKVSARDQQGIDGFPVGFYKIGTAPEAAGVWYSWHKDTGNPGVWAPGAPGLNGRATDGTTVTDNGCLPIKNPAAGNNYLTGFSCTSSVAGSRWLFDVMWVNSGLVVTTTTAQAIAAPVALPARDLDGTTNGRGVWAGILVTTATTNAGAIANTTMSYTNSDGTPGKTATIASYPATAVIGTVVWFQLAAGDAGVRSVQSVTLGTSYVAGAISIILARPLSPPVGNPVINVGSAAPVDPSTGLRLYNGTCALPIGLMSATTATSISGAISVAVR